MSSVDVLPRMADWWLTQGRPVAREDWETDAQLFLNPETGLRQVFWLGPEGKTSWCVHPGGVPDFHCKVVVPELSSLVPMEPNAEGPVLSRVVSTGEEATVYACIPVRRQHKVEYLAAAFDARALIRSLLKEQTPGDFGLEISADGQMVASVKPAVGPLWREGARSLPVKIANRSWSVQLIPNDTDIQTLHRLIWTFGGIVSILIYTCAALALVYKRKQSALRMEMEVRQKAEQKIVTLNRDLQDQVTDFRTLLDVLPVGIAVSNDPECRDIWVNPRLASMLHVSLKDNISRSAPRSGGIGHKLLREGREIPVDDLPMQKAARTKRPVLDLDIDILRDDGSVLNTLSYSAPVFDEQGKLRRVINACVDITDRRRSDQERQVLEERLLRAEKDRSLVIMASGLAHDFNNLLTIIMGNSEMARRALPPSSPAAASISEALSAGARAADVVAQLLAYTGRCWFEHKPLNLTGEVRSMWEQLRGMAPSHIEIALQLQDDLPLISGGAREVRQVLHHLMANAVEAIGDARGCIEVRTQLCVLGQDELHRNYSDQELAPGTYVVLKVSDSGSGVPQELTDRIFDPFFTTKFLGRGLGLSAVRGIMRAHGGGVHLGTSDRNGACVRAIFPLKMQNS